MPVVSLRSGSDRSPTALAPTQTTSQTKRSCRLASSARNTGTVRRMWWALSIGALGLPLAMIVSHGNRYGGDSATYVAAAGALVGDRDYADVQYPPGFPAMLAAADAVGMPLSWVSIGSGLLLVALIWWCAVRLSGPAGGAVAGILCSASPLIIQSGRLLMSDTPAAVLVLGGFACALRGHWRIGGVLFGLSAWVRLGHAIFAAASPRLRMGASAAAVIVPVLGFNLAVYGTVSGYEDSSAEFGFRYLLGDTFYETTKNASDYSNAYLWPAVLLGRFGVLVPLLPVFAAVELWHRRADDTSRLAVALIVLNIALYAFYFFQSFRFVLVAACVLIIYSSALAGRLTDETAGGTTAQPSCTETSRGRRKQHESVH